MVNMYVNLLGSIKDQLERTLKEMMSDKITIDLDVFDPFLKEIITDNLNGTLVVIVHRCGRAGGHTYIL